MSLVLVLGAYSIDPEYAVKEGSKYVAMLALRGTPAVCPLVAFDQLWKEGKITLEDIEGAVRSLYRKCSSVVVISKEGMALKDIVESSSGLQAEFLYMNSPSATAPIYYGLDNYIEGNIYPDHLLEEIWIQQNMKQN